MRRTITLSIICGSLLIFCAHALRAEHASINLQVIGPHDQVEAHFDSEPPEGGINRRPVLKVRAGDPLVVQFILTNVYPHGEIKDVTVRYFIVREEKLGQKAVPDLKKGVVTEGGFNMNFKPQCRVGARFQVAIKDPGCYLVRLETRNTKSDHEHFSAIDVQVD